MAGWLTAAALLAGLTACAPLQVVNALVPSGEFTLREGVPYGPDPRQRLDVYRPLGADGDAPVVVFFYGGRWQRGSREAYRLLAYTLTRRGFVVVVPDYRLSPEVEFPVFVEDGARAVAWVREHVARFGGSPDRIALAGHSAGAHIAALLTLDEHYLRDAGIPRGTVRGTVGLAGPYDFLPFTDADVRALMGPPEQWPETQPIRFVDGTEPPMLLLYGARDRTVRPGNSLRLAERIDKAGGCARTIAYPGLGHIGIVVAFAAPFLGLAPVTRDAVDFVYAVCGGGDAGEELRRCGGG